MTGTGRTLAITVSPVGPTGRTRCSSSLPASATPLDSATSGGFLICVTRAVEVSIQIFSAFLFYEFRRLSVWKISKRMNNLWNVDVGGYDLWKYI